MSLSEKLKSFKRVRGDRHLAPCCQGQEFVPSTKRVRKMANRILHFIWCKDLVKLNTFHDSCVYTVGVWIEICSLCKCFGMGRQCKQFSLSNVEQCRTM